MITDKGIEKVVNLLDAELQFAGVGTGATPQKTDTDLPGEQLRKAVTSYIDGSTLVKEIFIDETEGNGLTFTNAGIAANGATLTIESGDLFCGDVIDVAKDDTQSVTVSIEITVSEGATI